MKPITFIHAADLHLDSPMAGLNYMPETILKRIRESTFTALKKLTNEAIEKKVDFVILAGDLFDGEDRSLRAQSRLQKEMKRLEEYEIPIFVVHGNHDHLGGTWVNLDMPSNVTIFSSEVEIKTVKTKGGASVNISGFSYPNRHVFERKIADYQKREGADFHIGILHGNEGGKTEHGNYAPFNLKELLEKGYDYWALGHIHKRSVLSEYPPVVYPGNIQGRNRKETGKKGFYYVVLSEDDAKLEFIEASEVIWEETVIDAAGAQTFQDVFQKCQEALNQNRRQTGGTLLAVELKNVSLLDHQEKRGLDEELLEMLQEDEKNEESFVWVFDVKVSETAYRNKEQLKAEGEFYQELFAASEQFSDYEQALAPLYNHPQARKFLSSLTAEDKQQLKVQAESILIRLLNPANQ